MQIAGGSGMSQLTIRGVSEQDIERLREEAAERGCSINAIVREALAEHLERERHRRDQRDVIADLRRFREEVRQRRGRDFDDSTPLIRADRDR
jgi:plasmid stability protein